MIEKIKRQFHPLIISLGRKIERNHFQKRPLIIGACPRSGTTLLLAILGADPNLFAIANQTYAFDQWQEYQNPGEKDRHYRPTRLDRLYREFLFKKISAKAQRWVEKTPKHVQSFLKILDYLGDKVLLIHVVRDGRDVVTSKHPKHSPQDYWVSVQRWIDDVSIGLSLKDHPQVLTIRYEDLVKDFGQTMQKIYHFMQEPLPENLQEWKSKTTIQKSKHWAQPVQNLYNDAIARWKRPEHIERLAEIMAEGKALEILKQLKYI